MVFLIRLGATGRDSKVGGEPDDYHPRSPGKLANGSGDHATAMKSVLRRFGSGWRYDRSTDSAIAAKLRGVIPWIFAPEVLFDGPNMLQCS